MSRPEKRSEPERPDEAEAPPSGFAHVTAEDFAVGCEAPIAESRKIYCQCLGSLYQKAAQDAEATGDERTARVYRLLAAVTQIHFKPNDKAEPYGPMVVADGRRSLIPSDLRGAQSDVLAAVAPGISNPGLRARFADIAWLNDRKKGAMAPLAISAYCAAVQDVAGGKAEFFSRTPRRPLITALKCCAAPAR